MDWPFKLFNVCFGDDRGSLLAFNQCVQSKLFHKIMCLWPLTVSKYFFIPVK